MLDCEKERLTMFQGLMVHDPNLQLLLHPRPYLGARALLYFYSASMCTTGPLTAPTGLTPAVATISILSSYVLIRFTLPDLPNSSHFLTHVQPLPTDSPRLPLHRYVHA